MAVTITATKKAIVAGKNFVELDGLRQEIITLTGNVAASDTGTYTPTQKFVKSVVGLANQATYSVSNGVITFTTKVTDTAFNMEVQVLTSAVPT